MKILLASTIKRKVTKDMTYSRSRLLYQLALGLVARGHQVSLLGTGDSYIPGVEIIPIIDKGFIDKEKENAYENQFYVELGYLVKFVKKIEEIGDQFDIVHNHSYPEFLNLFANDKIRTPIVTTIHMSMTPSLIKIYDEVLSFFPKGHLVSISNAQRQHFKKTTINKVIYNGINTTEYPFIEEKQNYLFWMGRLGKAKNADGTYIDAKGISWAIKVAMQTGRALKLTGVIEDIEFFDKEVKPFLNESITWVGSLKKDQMLSLQETVQLYGKARAFLMTPNWDEAFGLVIAEAMSTGTPIIGFRTGSIPEIVVDGKTGFLSNYEEGVKGLATNVEKIYELSEKKYSDMSKNCRNLVERQFTIDKMINNYESYYKDILGI